MHWTRNRTRWLAAPVALAIAVGVSACGSDDGGASGTAPGGTQEGITITAAQYTWTAAKVTDAILAEIAKRHPELGVKRIETKQLDPAAAWAGAQRGDIDVLTEVALPNQQPLADKAKGQVDLLHQTYGDANQGWFVPSYAVKPGGKAAGLRNVDQLNRFKDVFGGKLYDADPGWVSTKQNGLRLEGYGIDYQHVTSSEAAELAQLKRAYDRKEPILLYLYRPH